MSISPIDYANQALSRICQQYRDKPKYTALVQQLAALVQTNIDEPIDRFLTIYDIDTATGANLDVIGEIVGQDRVLIDYDLFEFFGYAGAVNAGSYGDATNPNVGARYFDSGEDAGGDKTLSDAEYRTFIKARILKNYSSSTPEDIIEAVKLLLSVDQVYYTEGVMSIDIDVLGDLTDNQLALLQNYDIIPRPTGVGIGTVGAYKLLEFNGSTTSVIIPYNAALDIGSSDFGVKFSFIMNSYPSDKSSTIINKRTVFGSNQGFDMLINASGNLVAFINTTYGVAAVAEVPLSRPTGSLHTLAMIGKSGNVSVEVDGNSVPLKRPILVSGAGSASYNSYYTPQVGDGGIVSERFGRTVYRSENLSNYVIEYSGSRWNMLYRLDGSSDNVVYFNNSDAQEPPESGWESIDSLDDPAPTLSFSAIDVNDSGENIVIGESNWSGIANFDGIIFNTSLEINGVLQGEWLLTDSIGTTAADTSGNGNDGTITDPNWVGNLPS